MRKYKYIIGYNHKFDNHKIMFVPTETFCTDSFLVFLFKFLIMKGKYEMLTVEWNKPPI